MDSILIYQAANDLVQNTGTRNIKRIARSCSLDILETPRFKDVLGFLSLHFDKEELTAASPPDVKIGTKKFSKKAKK